MAFTIISKESIVGFLLAFYYLIGRWSLVRLEDTYSNGTIISQPRWWAIAALALLAFCLPSPGGLPLSCVRSVARLSLLFFFYMLCTATWAPASISNFDKALEVFLLILVTLSLTSFLSTNDAGATVNAFWFSLVGLTVSMAFLSLTNIGDERLSVIGGGPNVFGRSMILLFFGVTQLHSRFRFVGISVVVTTFILVTLLVVLSGSRGAFLSLLSGSFLYFAIQAKNSFARWLFVCLLVCVGLSLTVQFSNVGLEAVERFEQRFIATSLIDRYTSERDELFELALQTGLDYPIFGVGLDGFRLWIWDDYPHNLVLEIWAEGGAIGLALFSILFSYCAVSIARFVSVIDLSTLSATISVFVSAQFSGDLYDSRGVFLFLLLTFVFPRHRPVNTT